MLLQAWEHLARETTPAPHHCTPQHPRVHAQMHRGTPPTPGAWGTWAPSCSGHGSGKTGLSWPPVHRLLPGPGWNVTQIHRLTAPLPGNDSWKEYEKGKYVIWQLKKIYRLIALHLVENEEAAIVYPALLLLLTASLHLITALAGKYIYITQAKTQTPKSTLAIVLYPH